MKKKKVKPILVVKSAVPRKRVRKRRSNALVNADEKAASHNRRVQQWCKVGEITGHDLLDAMKSQEERCWYCQCEIDPYCWHTDHRVPLSRGGKNIPGNIVITCPECNLKKWARYPHEMGWRLI